MSHTPGEFAERVLVLVEQIPAGRVMTYGGIAATLGSRASRMVGQVLARYGSDVPWWRVIRAGGHPPPGHASAALDHYHAEGTPMMAAGSVEGYRVTPAALWVPPNK